MYEPGPIVIEVLPLGPRISQPYAFESIAAQFVSIFAGSDVGLSGSVSALAPYIDRSLESAYNENVAPAFGGLDGLGASGDGAELAEIAATIDGVIGDVGSQQTDLPGPNEAEPGSASGSTPDPGDFNPGAEAAPPRVVGPPEPPPSQPPPEPPPRSYRDEVHDAIRGLYLELLHREPDPGGWEFYTDQVVVYGQSIEWVRQQGYASDEYRVIHGG